MEAVRDLAQTWHKLRNIRLIESMSETLFGSKLCNAWNTFATLAVMLMLDKVTLLSQQMMANDMKNG